MLIFTHLFPAPAAPLGDFTSPPAPRGAQTLNHPGAARRHRALPPRGWRGSAGRQPGLGRRGLGFKGFTEPGLVWNVRFLVGLGFFFARASLRWAPSKSGRRGESWQRRTRLCRKGKSFSRGNWGVFHPRPPALPLGGHSFPPLADGQTSLISEEHNPTRVKAPCSG